MYQIVKGWPSHAAIDEKVTATAGQTLAPGVVAALTSAGTYSVADCADAGTDPGQLMFLIDTDKITGGFLGLAHTFVVEVDASHYAAGTYTPNAFVTVKAGKFAPMSGTAKAVGRILAYNATTKILRVLWIA